MAFEKDLVDRLHKLVFRDSETDEFYAGTYPIFLEFFRDRIAVDSVTESDAKIGAILAYSWMGQGKLKIASLENFGSAVNALLKAKSEKIDVTELQNIVNFVSGSLVGTSKYLHFLNPQCFAIWDSRVAWAGYRLKYNYQVEKPKHYIQYLEDLAELELPEKLSNIIMARIP
jgi:hypothetical protein